MEVGQRFTCDGAIGLRFAFIAEARGPVMTKAASSFFSLIFSPNTGPEALATLAAMASKTFN
ncbi:MAG: hypothetical protein ACP5QU_03170 [Anaerolineae bacterium]